MSDFFTLTSKFIEEQKRIVYCRVCYNITGTIQPGGMVLLEHIECSFFARVVHKWNPPCLWVRPTEIRSCPHPDHTPEWLKYKEGKFKHG